MTIPIPAPRRRAGYLLELAAAGELALDERRRVLAAAQDAACGDEPGSALARDAAATLARHPPEQVAAEVARRAGSGARARRRAILALPTLAAVAAAVAIAIGAPGRPQPAGRDGGGDGAGAADDVRVKGLAPHLVVHRRTASGAERMAPGTPARPGDLVQLGYVAGGRPWGVIVSVDGAGGVTRHWPVDGTMAAGLEGGREVLLPESFRLDDAQGFERFFLVTAAQPFPVAGVLAAARALASRPDALGAALPLPPGLAGADVVLAKELR
jgi:hypothetical protein